MREGKAKLQELQVKCATQAKQMIKWCGNDVALRRHLDALDVQIDELKDRLSREVYTARIRRLRTQIDELEAVARGMRSALYWYEREGLHPASNTGVERLCGLPDASVADEGQ